MDELQSVQIICWLGEHNRAAVEASYSRELHLKPVLLLPPLAQHLILNYGGENPSGSHWGLFKHSIIFFRK